MRKITIIVLITNKKKRT